MRECLMCAYPAQGMNGQGCDSTLITVISDDIRCDYLLQREGC